MTEITDLPLAELENELLRRARLTAVDAGARAMEHGNEHRVEDFVSNVSEKPSTSFHGDLYVVRLYNDDSLDPHVYEHVKHAWFKNNGQTLCICHFYDDGRYRFVMFQASSIRWWQIWPERFEQAR